MNDEPFFDTNLILYAFRRDDTRSQVAETLLGAGGALSVQVLNEFVAVARRKFDRAGRRFAAPSKSFAFFAPIPCHLRLRPMSRPWPLRSDLGIQSMIHSSSRLRSVPAPERFTRRTCGMARRSNGLRFAILFWAKGNRTSPALELKGFWCPGRESNPHFRCRKKDFKSFASASFATRADNPSEHRKCAVTNLAQILSGSLD